MNNLAGAFICKKPDSGSLNQLNSNSQLYRHPSEHPIECPQRAPVKSRVADRRRNPMGAGSDILLAAVNYSLIIRRSD